MRPISSPWTGAIDGERLDFTTGTLHEFTRRLDMHSGMYVTEALWESPCREDAAPDHAPFRACRATPISVYVQYALEPLNFSGRLQLRARIDTATVNNVEQRPAAFYRVDETCRPSGAGGRRCGCAGATDGMQAAFATGLRGW